jgi:hypothetical protein
MHFKDLHHEESNKTFERMSKDYWNIILKHSYNKV